MSFSTAAGANYWQANYAAPFVQTGRPFTIMAWVNLAVATTDFSCICSTYDGTANSWEFGARAPKYVGGTETDMGWYFTWSAGGTYYGHAASYGTIQPPASSVLAVNTWYHLCVRYGIDGVYHFNYVQDGVITGTSAAGTGAVAIAAGSRKFRVHGSADNATAGMPGRTACIRMFDGILTLEQINQNRTFNTCPISLRHRCLVDLSGRRNAQDIPIDLSPRSIGTFSKVGTVSKSFDPNGAEMTLKTRVKRFIGAAASEASVVYTGMSGRQAANRAGSY